jgi:SpoVK/Ycf46/Vps4 family AAA+-type ATPase
MSYLRAATLGCFMVMSFNSYVDAQIKIANRETLVRCCAYLKQTTISAFKQAAPLLLANGIVLGVEMLFNKVRAGAFGNTSRALFNQDPGPVPATRGMIAPATVPDVVKNEIISLIKEPERLVAAHAYMWNGIVFSGAAGIGKTELGFYIARETGCDVLYETASGLVAPAQGSGAASVRELFNRAYKKPLLKRIKDTFKAMLLRLRRKSPAVQKPVILILDEIDAIGQSRQNQVSELDQAREGERARTLEQLLTEIDIINQQKMVLPRVFVVGTTNRPLNLLDNALIRAGRLRPIHIPALTDEQREAVLRFHARGKLIAEDVDFGAIAQTTDGFSGADLKQLLNKAALSVIARPADEDRAIHQEQLLDVIRQARVSL